MVGRLHQLHAAVLRPPGTCPTASSPCKHAHVHHHRHPRHTLQNDVAGSLEDFDQVLQLEPRMRPYLWQRGLTLYYLQQYTEGAQQFR